MYFCGFENTVCPTAHHHSAPPLRRARTCHCPHAAPVACCYPDAHLGPCCEGLSAGDSCLITLHASRRADHMGAIIIHSAFIPRLVQFQGWRIQPLAKMPLCLHSEKCNDGKPHSSGISLGTLNHQVRCSCMGNTLLVFSTMYGIVTQSRERREEGQENGHKIPSPFQGRRDGDFPVARLRVEAVVAVPLHAEKLNILSGSGALLGTGRSNGQSGFAATHR